MPSKTSTILVSAAAVLAVASSPHTGEAFCPPASTTTLTARAVPSFSFSLLYETKESTPDAVFMPPESSSDDNEEGTEDEVPLDAVEMMGRGAAKVGRNVVVVATHKSTLSENCHRRCRQSSLDARHTLCMFRKS